MTLYHYIEYNKLQFIVLIFASFICEITLQFLRFLHVKIEVNFSHFSFSLERPELMKCVFNILQTEGGRETPPSEFQLQQQFHKEFKVKT
jgi:hypothetical protein